MMTHQTLNSGFANYDEDSEIIDFVTSKTNIELLELDFDEE
jgi:hypothetical protein